MATVTAHGVNFIDENDARRGFLALLEHVADTRRADADEHFDEIRAANGEERDVCFARDRARQQRLARAGRANHQNAVWNTAAEFLKLFRGTQKLDKLLHFILRFLDSCDIATRDLPSVWSE